ncbi:phage head closure protein [Sphingomonas sp. KC8]|uniref:phage head closure protein n=1 Tax=Sphingomonas sp. KC8 TaxID=1030157 RepID=UPI0002489BBB|nr:phage head closure protein [Sphingomonas sp. KC8]ARS29116.1 hypothetical protein KC8_17740 [Sphingomonas sp. KC8]
MSGAKELAGRLRQRIGIERRTAARDALGGAVGDWVTVATLWAAIEPVGVGALIDGEAIRARPRWRVTVRHGADVAVDDRIRWRGGVIRVRGVTADPATPDRILVVGEEEA